MFRLRTLDSTDPWRIHLNEPMRPGLFKARSTLA
ncbi:hypothetical protein Hoch_0608 [Haliangium ochraceum DSM 14365]|uniref:Uncharacterized protein n=1 Tax=Haliangium ochraceum (strain DSM 14365 / JCM 11303 / SMP-2) TaxID=502025 RepID=D0LLM8_HALO1|nr:hypothetical protein Hoch_0608 [Haliangium ochraceum DSM 14365]